MRDILFFILGATFMGIILSSIGLMYGVGQPTPGEISDFTLKCEGRTVLIRGELECRE